MGFVWLDGGCVLRAIVVEWGLVVGLVWLGWWLG